MDKQMMKNLKQAISSVLETMFFLPVQITAENSPRHNGWLQQQKTWHVALRFGGPLNGSFFLLVPAGLAQEITANFLGLDETDVDPSQETDTVKEALNMIGGYVLSQAKDADEYQIGIPEIVNADQADLAKMRLESQNTIIIETEEDHLAIGLDLD